MYGETLERKAGRVLVVDDNVVCRKALCLMLQRAGYKTAEAADGGAALERLRHDCFDCVLMDFQLPGDDGLSATAKLRRLEAHGPRTPVIAVTDCDQHEYYRRCLAAGVDGWLAKPVNRERLLTILSMSRILAAAPDRPPAASLGRYRRNFGITVGSNAPLPPIRQSGRAPSRKGGRE
jgi:CheY-like chemotaxis protein